MRTHAYEDETLDTIEDAFAHLARADKRELGREFRQRNRDLDGTVGLMFHIGSYLTWTHLRSQARRQLRLAASWGESAEVAISLPVDGPWGGL